MSAVNVTLKSPVSGLKVWFTYRPLTVCGEKRGRRGEGRGEEKEERKGRGRKSFKNHRPSLYIEAT